MGQYSNNFEAKKRQLQPPSEAQSALKDEIEQLQKELDSESITRSTLEKATHCQQPLLDDPMHKSLSQPAETLVKEIALLELEISYLEKYLLSLYRKSFSKRPSSSSALDRITSSEVAAKTNHSLEPVNEEYDSGNASNTLPASAARCDDVLGSDTLMMDSGIYQSHSSLSHYSANCSFRTSPPYEAFDSSHSLPLSMLEEGIFLVHFHQRTHDYTSNADMEASTYRDRETPNGVSEEMIKCISTVYCRLSNPPLPGQEQHHNDQEKSLFEFWPNNPLHYLEASEEFSGCFFTTVEIHGIVRDSRRLNSVQDLLQSYRSLISKLAQVDSGKLRHDEKLAFWINIHNALVMHAYMVYGIPKGNLKRISLVLKAAYNIGGHTISVDTIQSSILGCRLPRPTPWLHSLFFPKTKFKSGDLKKAFAVKHGEPRLRFALCSGCHSDPAVRLYTPEKVFQELEMAKEDYVEMNIKLHKEQRLVVPKIVEYFIKEMGGLSQSGLTEMVGYSMVPDSFGNSTESFQQAGKLWRRVDWIPHNFNFRFLLSSELIRRRYI